MDITVLGVKFIEEFYTIYDMENMRVGFAPNDGSIMNGKLYTKNGTASVVTQLIQTPEPFMVPAMNEHSKSMLWIVVPTFILSILTFRYLNSDKKLKDEADYMLGSNISQGLYH
jgi:hypothetical protein